MTRVFLFFAAAWAFSCACNIPEEICDTHPNDNVCSGPGDCVVAYCAADCSSCAAVYSKRQVEKAYCLTPLDESPNQRCREAAESLCTPSSLPSVCPRYIEPACEEGECVPIFNPPGG